MLLKPEESSSWEEERVSNKVVVFAGNNEFCKLGRLFCDCRLRCRKWSNADLKGEMTVEAHLGVQKSSIVSGIEIILI